MSSGVDLTRSSNTRGPDSWETVTAKTNICFFPTAMFTQDYSALDELETNWWLTHLEKSHGAAWHPSHGGKKGMWSKKVDPEKYLSFSMEPLCNQVHIPGAILFCLSAALKRKAKDTEVKKTKWQKRRKKQISLKNATGLWHKEGKNAKLSHNHYSRVE